MQSLSRAYRPRQVREQVELLKYHADVAAEIAQIFARGGDVDAIDEDAAVVEGLKPIDAAEQGALARA
jgi:hypothetical protein